LAVHLPIIGSSGAPTQKNLATMVRTKRQWHDTTGAYHYPRTKATSIQY